MNSMVAIENIRSRGARKAASPSFATTRLLMWLMLLPAIVDYKPKGAQDWTTILYAILFVISACASFALIGQYRMRSNRGAMLAGIIALAFAAVTYTSGILRGQDEIALLRAMPPILLFSLGMFSAAALSNAPFPPEAIFNEIQKATGIGLLINLILVASITGIDFETIRYQVLTGGAPLVCASMIALLMFGGWRPWSIATSLLYASLVLISITRTHVVIAAVLVLFSLLFAGEKVIRGRALPLQILAVLALVGAVLVADAVLPTSPLERWTQRIFSAQEHHGYDITAVTRAGETGYQIGKLKESVPGLMFGYGASASNFYDGENARIIALLLGKKSAYWTETGVGHNNYVGTIYIGGIIFGGALLLLQVRSLLKSISIFRALKKHDLDAHRLASIASMPLGVVAFMAFGFLGGTMGSRSACLLFGLAIGFSFWIAKRLKTAS
ncbi:MULTISPECIES: hypothetical protein [unclassified Caulobacter]|uniref:hypothetical protein n=1 Tax=unclassified Caulobacter TaxID=2648921 RepID=UPI000B16E7D4|nr:MULTISPECIES: hypothetical protein [unclassified Caulobacter]